ncbi:MAG TPA: tRNA preQ1(34) S-adenosylmethionine ribosyltransferase-isomerase QueA, partial [Terriglobales bacterium]|nr:tRNA preQ1(34) S-adenosylmethionine ribosyltransferase-isomerase QueA [Terriglobales bacterium]
MKLTEFDYELPPERIAQRPPEERDASRLLWLHRQSGEVEDRQFRELPELLVPGDLLVANDSRVFPARLLGQRVGGGQGKVEVLLLREVELGVWDVLARPGRKLPLGELVIFEGGLRAEVVGMGSRGERQFRFEVQGEFAAAVERHGHVPLPPYIRREDQVEDRARYQTVYAKAVGSAAAPTAGLHFSERVLEKLAERGIEWATVSLHVGLGTFQAVESEEIEDHPMHSEAYTLGPEAAVSILQARSEGRRVIAVGTTAARVLETAAPQFV